MTQFVWVPPAESGLLGQRVERFAVVVGVEKSAEWCAENEAVVLPCVSRFYSFFFLPIAMSNKRLDDRIWHFDRSPTFFAHLPGTNHIPALLPYECLFDGHCSGGQIYIFPRQAKCLTWSHAGRQHEDVERFEPISFSHTKKCPSLFDAERPTVACRLLSWTLGHGRNIAGNAASTDPEIESLDEQSSDVSHSPCRESIIELLINEELDVIRLELHEAFPTESRLDVGFEERCVVCDGRWSDSVGEYLGQPMLEQTRNCEPIVRWR